MKNIVISGYYGFNNLGDEAVLAGISSLLKRKREDLKITVLSAEPEQTADRYGLNAVSRTSVVQILAALAEADLFISGGGSLLQDVTGSFSVPYYLGLAWLARLQGTKTVYYAQGAGPLNKKWSQLLTAFSLNRFELLGVRDQGSQNLLQEIGVKKEIELTVDPVFALYDPLNNLKQQIKGKIEVGISVRPWSVDYISELAAALNQFAEGKKVKFIIFPMHQGSDEESSLQLQKKLKAEAEICALPPVPGEALKVFSQLDLFVGVRLHSLIFALLNQIPLLALSYDPKIEGLLSELDYLPLIKLEDLKADQAAAELENIFAARYSLRKKIKGFIKLKKAGAEDFAELVLEEVDTCES
ncbi:MULTISPECIES: polysaccharide pyruvyl transferase CsaB [Halanaerobium]|jgi:polysaccharide pyruvyl transferase CsaB|uniref:Polysaccharide pyruvyl transferase CsaB n=1 Tax=Halanaerobium saccharolyticum TaxID=43595 RepID=A0A4R6RZU9_9FIRM|nr:MULTISPECIES: polysaccharide pyruvyl transferase CsaB [Halanaerobium]PUU95442.1 MAG: polysaccharide pyruvyl transferase CsaB [Halanaerobium sp.]TDP92741.1 polysaccharide pyruvyl transferase CsaB [Halanaerobium saccharolyticum]